MRKYIFSFLITTGFLSAVMSQVAKKDSLLNLLRYATADTTKMRLNLEIGIEYENNEPEIAKQYFQQTVLLSQKLGDKQIYYKTLGELTGIYLMEGKIDSLLFFSQNALAVARELNDSLKIGMSLFNVGIAYREQSEFEKAIDYSIRGRKIMEEKGDKNIVMQMNDGLQLLYYTRLEYDKAIVYGEEAVLQARELKQKRFLAQVLINLSRNYIEKKASGKAHSLLLEAIDIGKELQDKQIEAVATSNLAELSLRERDYTQTRKYIERSLVLYRELGSVDGEAVALKAMGITYLQQGDLINAKVYAEKALLINRENKFKKEEVSVLRLLSSIAYANHDFAAGIDYDDKSNLILERMIKDLISQNSVELEKKYETEKKELKIRELEADKKVQQLSMRQKTIFIYITAAGAVILLIISLLSYRTYHQKQRLQQQRIAELETQQYLMATEAVLKGEEQERTRLAKDLHDGLGGMLSGIKYSLNTMKGNLIMTPDNAQAFERSMDMLDSSIKEMRRVAHNMMPEALVKFGLDTALKDFCNDINQSGALKANYQSIGLENETIDQTTSITIYRIVQELINNTIKHAGAKNAIVQVSKSGSSLSITVEDDGKGFDTSLLKSVKGIGWSNIQNRVEFLKGKLDVHSQPGNGTSVLIEFNI